MGFFFAYPVLLWGMFAAAIPLMIHLLRRRRVYTRILPTMRFLTEAHRKQRFNIQLQDLLLLILRTLLILIVVMALAGPKILTGSRGSGLLYWLGQESVQRVILVDVSRSMAYQEAGDSRLGHAVQGAQSLLDRLPATVETLVVPFAEGGEEDERNLPASFSRDRDYWKRQLDSLEPAKRPTRISWALERSRDLLAEAADGGVFLLTDLQRSGWEDLLARRIDQNEFSFPISVIDVSIGLSRNVWMDWVKIPRLPPGVGEISSIQVEIASKGYPDSKELPLKLELLKKDETGDTLTEVAHRDVLLQDGQRLGLALPFIPEGSGIFKGVLSLTGLEEEDPLSADNEVDLECPLIRDLEVVVGIPDSEGTGSSNVENSQPFSFLRSCFKFGLETPGSNDIPAFIKTRFPTSNESLVPLSSQGVVILYGPPSISQDQQSRLIRFVREGGGILIFVDPSMNPGGILEELGVEYSTSGIVFNSPDSKSSTLQLRAENHPVFDPFENFGPSLLNSVKVWEPVFLQLSGGVSLVDFKIDSGTSEIQYLSAIQEKRLESGRVIVVGIPLGKNQSNLATSAVWVPLIQQLVKYLATPLLNMSGGILEGLYPAESDLSKLTTSEKKELESKLPISFSSVDSIDEAIALGRGSKDLTSLFLILAVILGLVEVFLSNRMR